MTTWIAAVTTSSLHELAVGGAAIAVAQVLDQLNQSREIERRRVADPFLPRTLG